MPIITYLYHIVFTRYTNMQRKCMVLTAFFIMTLQAFSQPDIQPLKTYPKSDSYSFIYNRGAAPPLSPDGKYTLVYDHFGIKLFDLKLGKPGRTVGPLRESVQGAAISPDGKYIGVSEGVFHNVIKIWDFNTGEEIQAFNAHYGDIAFSEDSRLITVGGQGPFYSRRGKYLNFDGDRFIVAKISSDKFALLCDTNSSWGTINLFSNHNISITLSPDHKTGLFCKDSISMDLLDVATGHTLTSLIGHTEQIGYIAYLPNNKFALSSAEDGTIRLWDLSNGKCARIFFFDTLAPPSLSVSADGSFFLAASYDGLTMWDLSDFTGSVKK